MKTIPLNQLQNYLAYGLKIYCPNRAAIKMDYATMNPNGGTSFESIYNVIQYGMKPIVRPMSDLDDPKKYTDDKHYSFLDELRKYFDFSYDIDADLDFFAENRNSYLSCHESLKVYEFLFKNHFDVFGWISDDLAFDINQIDK